MRNKVKRQKAALERRKADLEAYNKQDRDKLFSMFSRHTRLGGGMGIDHSECKYITSSRSDSRCFTISLPVKIRAAERDIAALENKN